jgi:sugar lactone lactonase YvrE
LKKGRELERKGLSNWKAVAKVISLGVGATLVLGVGVQAQAVTVSTVAGSYHERGHLDGTGREARFEFPQGIVAAPDGSIYIADTGNDMIRKISSNGLKESMPTPAHLHHLTYEVETIAGANHRARFRDGVGPNSRFNNPEGLAISPDGKTLYVADSRNNRIRKIDLATKTVSTLAGRAFAGGNDGVGTGAGLNTPRGLAISPDGNTLYIADSGNNAIRKMDLGTSQVTTIAGGGAFMPGYADGVGTQATFKEPRGLAISSDGQVLYIADTRNNLIRKMVIATGNVSTIAGHAGFPGTLNGPGPDAYFYQPVSLALDGNKLYVADGANADIRMVDLGTGTVSTVAGATLNGGVPIAGREDGDGVEGHFQFPGALTTFHGLIFVTDSPADTIREVSF